MRLTKANAPVLAFLKKNMESGNISGTTLAQLKSDYQHKYHSRQLFWLDLNLDTSELVYMNTGVEYYDIQTDIIYEFECDISGDRILGIFSRVLDAKENLERLIAIKE